MKRIVFILFSAISVQLTCQTLIKNLAPGSTASQPYCFFKFDKERAVFFGDDGTSNDGLYVTDGTSVGTMRLASLNRYPSSSSFLEQYQHGNQTGFTKIDSLGFIIGTITTGSSATSALIRTNGTLAGTSSHVYTPPSPDIPLFPSSRFFKLQNSICWLYFQQSKYYMYKYDVLSHNISCDSMIPPGGFQILYYQKNYNSGVESTVPFNDHFTDEVLTNGTEFFGVVSGYNNFPDSIYKIDINFHRTLIDTASTFLFNTQQTGVLINNKYLFKPNSNIFLQATIGNEPHVLDIVNYNFGPLLDINPYFNYSSSVEFLPLPLDDQGHQCNHIYFTAQHADYGREVWVTDGTPVNTHLVKDLVNGPPDGISHLPTYNSFYKGDSLFFTKNPYWGDTVRLITSNDIVTLSTLAPNFVSGGEFNYAWAIGNEMFVMNKMGYIYHLGYSSLPIDTLSPLSCNYSNASLINLFSTISANGCLFFTQDDCGITGFEPFKYCNSNLSTGFIEGKPVLIDVYPNPTSDYLKLNINGGEIKSLIVYDMLGKTHQISIENNIIDVRSLDAGIYIVNISCRNGKSYRVRIVKS